MKKLFVLVLVSGGVLVFNCQAANSAFTVKIVNNSKGAIGAAAKFMVNANVGTVVDSKDNIAANGGKAVLTIPASRPASCGDLYVRDESGAAPGNWVVVHNWVCGQVTYTVTRDAAGNFTAK